MSAATHPFMMSVPILPADRPPGYPQGALGAPEQITFVLEFVREPVPGCSTHWS
jgi:hypothetical protein